MTLAELDAAELIDWLAEHEWAPNTRRKAVQNLRLFWKWATEVCECAPQDPTAALKSVRGAVAVPRPVPEDVYAAAYNGAWHYDRMVLRLAAETGMRRAELAAVHGDDVTLGVLGYSLFVDGKGRRQRSLPIADDLAHWIEGHGGFVFASPRGGHMIPSAVGKRYKALLGGVWTTHSLRHRFATRAYATTHDIEAVRALLGHDSVRTTQIYIQTAEQQLRDVAQAAAGIGMTAA